MLEPSDLCEHSNPTSCRPSARAASTDGLCKGEYFVAIQGQLELAPLEAKTCQPCSQARKAMGDSSVLAAGSEGTVGTVIVSGARCPEGLSHSKRGQPGPACSPPQAKMPEQQQQDDVKQRPEEMPDKRQKVQGDRPEALAQLTATVGQQHAPAGEPSNPLKTPPPIKTKPQPEQHQDAQPEEADNHIAQAMTSRMGKLGMEVIRDMLMSQQALFTEQVRICSGTSMPPVLHTPVYTSP